ncbi:hypothetical protein BASA50_011278 [Batrachochytrium salamandrivorans]|uniref:Uncharacterized protein n=1 Tax=Batrachochytrium salamandrivorans TaxID=1357716 RepID=A0ABQ8EZ50_9FUNG|nr:hypothetical protein BASA60_007875 [Batrachochytrium salamandrivorans]KAH6580797.1 hypothetical protein BASA61_009407 [Batrachochytrium salamandrivorans]KAH6587674.1 hypothetical protein BASA50_011278 [Batrachochytrium salamandrivorans]
MTRIFRFACIRKTHSPSSTANIPLHRDMKYAHACAAAAAAAATATNSNATATASEISTASSFASASSTTSDSLQSPTRVGLFSINDSPVSSNSSSTSCPSSSSSSTSTTRSRRKCMRPTRSIPQGTADTVPGLVLQLGFGSFGTSGILRTVEYTPFPTRRKSSSANMPQMSAISTTTPQSRSTPSRLVRTVAVVSKAKQTAASRAQAKATAAAKRAATKAATLAAALTAAANPNVAPIYVDVAASVPDTHSPPGANFDPLPNPLSDSSCKSTLSASDNHAAHTSGSGRPVRAVARNRKNRTTPY